MLKLIIMILLSSTAVLVETRTWSAMRRRRNAIVPVIPIVPGSQLPVSTSATILHQVQDILPNGNYYYSYRTSNGITAEESRIVFQHQQYPRMHTKIVRGRFMYTSPEGVPVSVNYDADKNGYRPRTKLGHIGGGGVSRPRMGTQQR